MSNKVSFLVALTIVLTIAIVAIVTYTDMTLSDILAVVFSSLPFIGMAKTAYQHNEFETSLKTQNHIYHTTYTSRDSELELVADIHGWLVDVDITKGRITTALTRFVNAMLGTSYKPNKSKNNQNPKNASHAEILRALGVWYSLPYNQAFSAKIKPLAAASIRYLLAKTYGKMSPDNCPKSAESIGAFCDMQLQELATIHKTDIDFYFVHSSILGVYTRERATIDEALAEYGQLLDIYLIWEPLLWELEPDNS